MQENVPVSCSPLRLVPYVDDELLYPQQVKRERVEEEMKAEVEAWKLQQDEEEKAEKVRNGEQGWEQESSWLCEAFGASSSVFKLSL